MFIVVVTSIIIAAISTIIVIITVPYLGAVRIQLKIDAVADPAQQYVDLRSKVKSHVQRIPRYPLSRLNPNALNPKP